jgi:hypothetical protein
MLLRHGCSLADRPLYKLSNAGVTVDKIPRFMLCFHANGFIEFSYYIDRFKEAWSSISTSFERQIKLRCHDLLCFCTEDGYKKSNDTSSFILNVTRPIYQSLRDLMSKSLCFVFTVITNSWSVFANYLF